MKLIDIIAAKTSLEKFLREIRKRVYGCTNPDSEFEVFVFIGLKSFGEYSEIL